MAPRPDGGASCDKNAESMLKPVNEALRAFLFTLEKSFPGNFLDFSHWRAIVSNVGGYPMALNLTTKSRQKQGKSPKISVFPQIANVRILHVLNIKTSPRKG